MTTSVAAARDGGDRRSASRITGLRAADAALKTIPGGHIEGLEMDYDGRRLVWETDVLAVDGTWRELHLDVHDGRVLADQIDRPEVSEDGDGCDDPKSDEGVAGPAAQSAALRSAKISASRAARVALEEVPGTMVSVDFEYRRTAHVWEIDITAENGTAHKLKVDAASGALVANISGGGDD
ncbi:PepSY domain-containing protein [Actinomadura sp. CNU-125]|uniref:PepSY domain-containing protein n=1 Tax=Actinomadura sp. CNU-125 TaxID=1904961 RepID=UPI00130108D1|nr:PepSY domain-containing protein [Actinomadura sp. CNU-125]